MTAYRIAVLLLAILASLWLVARLRWIGVYVVIVVLAATLLDFWSRELGLNRLLVVGSFMFFAALLPRVASSFTRRRRREGRGPLRSPAEKELPDRPEHEKTDN